MMTANLILLRHGQSVWNQKNLFTGWTDVDLSPQGLEEARRAAGLLKAGSFQFDQAYTSFLKRAIRTLWIVLDEMDRMWLPVTKDWRLNERHYGALQGHSKTSMADRVGPEKTFEWRRGYMVRPPVLHPDDSRHPEHDPRYAQIDPKLLPASESLHDTLQRVLPCWQQTILPRLLSGERILIVAHHNSLRALVKYLDQIPENKIPLLNIPTGYPLVYEIDQRGQVESRHYLGEPAEVKAAAEAVYRIPESIHRRLSRQK